MLLGGFLELRLFLLRDLGGDLIGRAADVDGLAADEEELRVVGGDEEILGLLAVDNEAALIKAAVGSWP